ncbi:MAG: hypothetical protein Q9174_006176 [Haloplaca sp. 1 TL-2023]
MDVLTRWFQFKLGVEPNKQTLQGLAQGVNDYISTLAEGQKALEQYASDARPEQFLSSTPLTAGEKQKLIDQYVHSPAGREQLDKTLRKQEKAQRQPIIWQIPEEKMNELKWQRTQLLRQQAQAKAKANPQGAKKAQPVQKVTQGPVKKVGPQKQAPKLGSSKASIASGPASKAAGTQKQAANNAKKAQPKAAPAKQPGKTAAKVQPKMNGVAK